MKEHPILHLPPRVVKGFPWCIPTTAFDGKKHLIFVVPRMLARGAQQNLAAAFSLSTSNSGAQRTCR